MARSALSAAYFVGELLIPNISGTSTTETANIATLSAMIAKYEPRFLKMLLGDDLYDAYIAGMAPASPAAKWVTLDGMIYDTVTGYSPAAGFVYFYFQRNAQTVTMPAGSVRPATENGEVVSAGADMCEAWNEMVTQCEEIRDYINNNISDYQEFEQPDPDYLLTRINLYGC